MTGLSLAVRAAHRLGLLPWLDGFEPCKQRLYDSSKQENVMALLGCLTSVHWDALQFTKRISRQLAIVGALMSWERCLVGHRAWMTVATSELTSPT